MIDLHAVQREIALIGVRLGKTGGGPLREVEALGVRQIILAGTGGQAVGVERCGAITDLADLAGACPGNIPSVPSGREHMLATEQNTPDAIIGPANLVVERRHSRARSYSYSIGIGGTTVGTE